MSTTLRIGVSQSFGGPATPQVGYAGRVSDITPQRPAKERIARRDVIIPVGYETVDVGVAPGRYLIEAFLPSGGVLEDEVSVKEGEVAPVEFSETASPHEWLGWQTATGNLERILQSDAPAPPPPREARAKSSAGSWIALAAGLVVIAISFYLLVTSYVGSSKRVLVQAGEPASLSAPGPRQPPRATASVSGGFVSRQSTSIGTSSPSNQVADTETGGSPVEASGSNDAGDASQSSASSAGMPASNSVDVPDVQPSMGVPLSAIASPQKPGWSLSKLLMFVFVPLGGVIAIAILSGFRVKKDKGFSLEARYEGKAETDLKFRGDPAAFLKSRNINIARLEVGDNIELSEAPSAPSAAQTQLVRTPNGAAVWSALSRAFEQPDILPFQGSPSPDSGLFEVTQLQPDAADGRFAAFHIVGDDPGRDLSVLSIPAHFCLTQHAGGRAELMAIPIPWRNVMSGTLAVVDLVNVSSPGGDEQMAGTVQDPQLGTYLGYLAGGRLAEARTVIDQALEMLFSKYENPFAAAAGGYVLISAATAKRDEPWRGWLANLSRSFTWLPDGAVLYGWSLMASDDDADIDLARASFLEAYRRGLPFFAEGVRRLRNGLAMFVGEDPDGEIKAALKVVDSVAERCNPQQAFTSIRLGA